MKKPDTKANTNVVGRSRLFLIPLFMATLFTGAVIGMYFQPPGLKAFFNVTGLQPGAGTETPIAVAIAEYIRSLIHSEPDHVYVFGKVSQDVKSQVADITKPN